MGDRYIDNLVDGVAMESKVGRTSLSSRVRTQVLKDVELIDTPGSGIDSVEWHFFPSRTGVGPTGPLANFLNEHGITTIIH